MNFDQFLSTRLSKEDYEKLDQHLRCSPHRRTKILRNPAIAANHEILILAQLLKLPAYYLIDTYNLGKDKLTEIEINNHHEFLNLQKQLEQTK